MQEWLIRASSSVQFRIKFRSIVIVTLVLSYLAAGVLGYESLAVGVGLALMILLGSSEVLFTHCSGIALTWHSGSAYRGTRRFYTLLFFSYIQGRK